MNNKNKNKINNNKNNMNNVQIKTKVKTRSRIVIGLITALVVITAIGSAIYLAGIVPPAGCQQQDDGVFKCDYTENFANNSNIDENKSDAWMQIKDNHLVLNPSEQIKLHKGNTFDNTGVASPKQLCGTICVSDDCDTDLADPSQINIQSINATKNGVEVGQDINFLDINEPYAVQAIPFNNLGFFMFDSSNPEVAVVSNILAGATKANISPLSPGKTQIGINLCGERKNFLDLNVTDEGFAQAPVDRLDLNRTFVQGLSVSKNISSALDDKYNVKSADLNINIAHLEGLLKEGVDQNAINGIITMLLSNDNGKTWYLPSQYSEDGGITWLNFRNDVDFKLKAFVVTMANLGNRMWRYNFTYSEGHELKWTTIMQLFEVQGFQIQNGQGQQIDGLDNNILIPNQGGAADNFEVGMTSSALMNIRNNNDRNPMLENDLANGGIVGAGVNGSSTYYFLSKLYWPNGDGGAIDNTFNSDNVTIENLALDVLHVSDPFNQTIKVAKEQGQPTDHMPAVSSTIGGNKAGYGKIKVTYFEPGNRDIIRAEREYGFIVLPKSYLNLDMVKISYFANRADDVDGDDEDGDDQNQGVGTSTYIYRGANRVIVKLSGANDETKNQLKSAYDAKTLKFEYGKNENNLDKNAKIYLDSKDGKYYAVLKDLLGGKKDNYNQDGFSDGRMQYYYKFKAGDKDIYLDSEKKNIVGDFKTLNRKRTILYYYNWIFNHKYNLNKDYNWSKIQNGGINFWYETNITLPGIRFMMLNDRKYKEFNNYLNKKKASKKLVNWLYKKTLDRIYDDNLYKFADNDGINYWYRQMTKIRKKDRISKEGVKFAISASKESRNELQELFDDKNLANAEFSYNVVLKRGGDQDGVNYLIETFGDSQKRMREDLANSFEYNNRLESIENDLGRKAAIAELYETLYARSADVSGVDYWAKGNLTIPQIKEDFLHSDEFVNVLK